MRDPAGPGGVAEVLVRVDEPLVVLPQLAIHLDRDVNERGPTVDAQRGLAALWGVGEPLEGTVLAHVADRAGVAPGDVLGWDLMVHDLSPGRIAGADQELICAPRLDNLASCWAALGALRAVAAEPEPGSGAGAPIAVVALFDHEEVGSGSERGAASTLLNDVVERLGIALGASQSQHPPRRAASAYIRADMAHAVRPDRAERHEPGHPVALMAAFLARTSTVAGSTPTKARDVLRGRSPSTTGPPCNGPTGSRCAGRTPTWRAPRRPLRRQGPTPPTRSWAAPATRCLPSRR